MTFQKIKINTDFDSAKNLEQIIQFEPKKEVLFLPLWCDGKMLLSPVKSWKLVDNRWNVPLCDENEAIHCLVSANKNLDYWKNKKTIKERLNYLIKFVDLLNKNLYINHFEKNFFAEANRTHLLKFFIESIRQHINFYLNLININNNDEKNTNEILCLVLNNSDYKNGEQQFFYDFAEELVLQIFIKGKSLIIKPSPNLSPFILALCELTSRIQPIFPLGIINVLHGNSQIISDIYNAFNKIKTEKINNINKNTNLIFSFIANKNLQKNYAEMININENL